MKPILPGGRGPAVEDVQRRLLSLGYDLGPTGVDGVFLGRTRDAVTEFQHEHGLAEDGIVSAETWAALVDATFTLGDRTLYLRLPHFHGRDVGSLQVALNALGFSCGTADSIFGPFTERAVREFQRNSGVPADGIVGPETVRTVERLRHVWEGKQDMNSVVRAVGTARLSDVLSATAVVLEPRGDVPTDVARRIVNLALATDEAARVSVGDHPDLHPDIVIELREEADEEAVEAPVVRLSPADAPEKLHLRIRTALEVRSAADPLVVELPSGEAGEDQAQRYAILLLDALCAALS